MVACVSKEHTVESKNPSLQCDYFKPWLFSCICTWCECWKVTHSSQIRDGSYIFWEELLGASFNVKNVRFISYVTTKSKSTDTDCFLEHISTFLFVCVFS